MRIHCVWEHNGEDSLLYSENFPGAFTRGQSMTIALSKMKQEVEAYLRWAGEVPEKTESFELEIVQEKSSELDIRNADSDVLFNKEREPLTKEEYEKLKTLALKSAEDFLRLYEAIPDKDSSKLPLKKCFYGEVPRTAREMYEHTKCVNSYYFGEIDVPADRDGSILECRIRGFDLLEKQQDFLQNRVYEGSYDEEWSLRKVLRRFIWHDRIHAKAMWRMAKQTFPEAEIPDVFRFEG